MKLTTQSQRAVMAMMSLALNAGRQVQRLSCLAKEQGISLSYMEQLFYRLRHAGLVEGIRGPGGGYRLGKPSQHITVADIIHAIENGEDAEEQEAEYAAKTISDPMVNTMMASLDEQFHNFLQGITLASLIGDHRKPEIEFRVGSTANLIARMFPAHHNVGNSGNYQPA